MRKKRNKLCLLLAILITAGSVSALPVKAGSSTIKLNEASYQQGLDETLWHDADGDILTEKSAIVFPDNSTDATKLITKTDVVRIEQLETMLETSFKMKFGKLPEGESFVFGIGLSSLEAGIGEKGNLEIAFFNKGGLKVQVSAYEEADTPTVMVAEKALGSIGNTVRVDVTVTTSGKLTFNMNGITICDTQVPVSCEGSVGFLQTGSCGVRLTDVEIDMYKYDRPENSDIFEDFEAGDFNVNLFGSKMTHTSNYSPCYLAVEEYNGNQVLMFKNVNKGYIATTQQYSNFELTFDMPYIQTKAVQDEEGNIITPRFNSFGVSFGGDVGGKDEKVEFTGATELLLFMGSGVMGWHSKYPMTQATVHKFGDADCEKSPTIKVTVIDGIVTVQVKWVGEEDSAYETLMTYEINETPTGYVAIWAPSEATTSFAIDNISIRNMDKDARLVEVDKVSSKWTVPGDYDYQPTEKVYREKDNEITTDKWYLPMLITAGSCIVIIGFTVGAVTVGKRKRKSGTEHEK